MKKPSKHFLLSIALLVFSFSIFQFVILPTHLSKYNLAQVAKIHSLKEVKESTIKGNIRFQHFHELDTKRNSYREKNTIVFIDTLDNRSIKIDSKNIDESLDGLFVEYDLSKKEVISVIENENFNKKNNRDAEEEYKVLVLLAQFENSTPINDTAEDFQKLFFDGRNQSYITKFFKEASHNKVNIVGEVYGWNTIRGNGADFQGGPINNSGTCFLSASDIQNMASYYNLDISQYDRVVTIANCADYNTIGGAYYGLVPELGVHLVRTVSHHSRLRTDIFGYENFDEPIWNIIHELGHSFSMHHSMFKDCGDRTIWQNCSFIDYGNPFDVMGHGRIPGFDNQRRAGWIDEENILQITESGEYYIDNLQTEDGVVAAEIYVDGVSYPFFSVEHRKAEGFDTNLQDSPNVTSGLLLYSKNLLNSYYPINYLAYGNSMIDPNPTETESYADLYNDAIVDSFYDEISGIGINILNVTDSGINFSVSYDYNNSGCFGEVEIYDWCSTIPINLQLDSHTHTTANLSWEGDIGINNYRLQKSTSSDFSGSDSYMTSNENFTLSWLSPGTTYFVRVASCTLYNSCGSYSDPISFTTQSLPQPPNINLDSYGFTNANFVWDSVSDASYYRIQLNLSDNVTNLNNSNTQNHSVDFTGLSPGTTYFVKAASCLSSSQNSCGSYSDSISFTTESLLTPTNFNLNSYTHTTANFSWDFMSNVSRYRIQSSLDDDFTNLHVHYPVNNNNSTNLTPLSPGTTYFVRVASCLTSSALCGSYSDPISFTTESLPPPSNLLVIPSNDNDSAYLSWNEVPNATHYKLQVFLDDAYTLPFFVDDVFIQNENFTLIGLSPGTTYFVRVSSCIYISQINSCDENYSSTSFTAEDSFVSSNVLAPTNLLVNFDSNSSMINLSWVDNSGESYFRITGCPVNFDLDLSWPHCPNNVVYNIIVAANNTERSLLYTENMPPTIYFNVVGQLPGNIRTGISNIEVVNIPE